MGKIVSLIGMGCGPYTVTAEGMMAIVTSELIFGSKRMTELLPADTEAKVVNEHDTKHLKELIGEADAMRIAVLYSGDVGLYSGAVALSQSLQEADIEVNMIPGISVVSYFAARIGAKWDEFNVVSSHGRVPDLEAELKYKKPLFILTAGDSDARDICKKLCEMGYDDNHIIIGERLGYPDERIRRIEVSEAQETDIDKLNVMLLEI